MNLSERSRVDKEIFYGEQNSYENTLFIKNPYFEFMSRRISFLRIIR